MTTTSGDNAAPVRRWRAMTPPLSDDGGGSELSPRSSGDRSDDIEAQLGLDSHHVDVVDNVTDDDDDDGGRCRR
ncbi:hypothetical protein FISHEDRAFT_74487 [Fistulina hepatica ATCC 64428]|uniref:Uncharacterized protein n=1 Tax=Fistulina hepatica ATCC 64428 TaxID=1128425 RepID=A0A0D7A9Q5_9AGAR|nr:hypothetical protein FISHEDRAFT_74487 [Fistulina hepatica ATCC 64428]